MCGNSMFLRCNYYLIACNFDDSRTTDASNRNDMIILIIEFNKELSMAFITSN